MQTSLDVFLSMDKGFRDTANMQELFQPVGEQQDSQQMKEAWQDHIKAAGTAYEDAKNVRVRRLEEDSWTS